MNAAVAAKRQWSWIGAESVYPYWGVSRWNKAEMRKRQAQEETSTLRFNMRIIETQYASVTVGCIGRSIPLTVMVPALANTVAL